MLLLHTEWSAQARSTEANAHCTTNKLHRRIQALALLPTQLFYTAKTYKANQVKPSQTSTESKH